MNDECKDEITRLKAEFAALRHSCAKAEVDISERDILIAELKARVAELESHAPITPLVEDVVKAGVYSFVAMKLPGEQHE